MLATGGERWLAGGVVESTGRVIGGDVSESYIHKHTLTLTHTPVLQHAR